MAEAASSMFTKKAMDKLRSPDDLDKYVSVTNPSVWVILAACLALLAGILTWGIFGAVTTSVTTSGAVESGEALCLLTASEAREVHVGDEAVMGGQRVTVKAISATPLSRGEVAEDLANDFLTATLMKEDWAYKVTLEGDTSALPVGVPLDVRITVERVAPISLVVGGQS